MKKLFFVNFLKLKGFSKEQANQIFLGKQNGLDIDFYASKDFSPEQMEQIRLGLEMGVDVKKYAKTCFDSFEMMDIRKSLMISPRIEKFIGWIPSSSMIKLAKLDSLGIDITNHLNKSVDELDSLIYDLKNISVA